MLLGKKTDHKHRKGNQDVTGFSRAELHAGKQESNALTDLKNRTKQNKPFQSRILCLAKLSWIETKTSSDMWGFKIIGGYALVWGSKSSKGNNSDSRKRDSILKEFSRLIYCKWNYFLIFQTVHYQCIEKYHLIFK